MKNSSKAFLYGFLIAIFSNILMILIDHFSNNYHIAIPTIYYFRTFGRLVLNSILSGLFVLIAYKGYLFIVKKYFNSEKQNNILLFFYTSLIMGFCLFWVLYSEFAIKLLIRLILVIALFIIFYNLYMFILKKINRYNKINKKEVITFLIIVFIIIVCFSYLFKFSFLDLNDFSLFYINQILPFSGFIYLPVRLIVLIPMIFNLREVINFIFYSLSKTIYFITPLIYGFLVSLKFYKKKLNK